MPAQVTNARVSKMIAAKANKVRGRTLPKLLAAWDGSRNLLD